MHTVSKSSSSRVSRIRPIAFSLFALAASQLALGQAAAPATAEKKSTEGVPVEATNSSRKDEVVVLETFKVSAGFSGSLAAAAIAKENNQAIVEVIMAEDIGKLKWTPKTGQVGSLTQNQENDPYVQETSSA